MAPISKEPLSFEDAAVRAAACRRVFIVEDDEVLRNGLRRGLRRLGYEVCGEAASGEDALAQIPEVRPDVVVMDVGLSTAVSGVAVAERLRSVVDIPIVFLTGSTDAATVKLAAETGSFAYIIKPVDARTLAANLEVAATKHAAEVRLRQARVELEQVNAKLRDSEERYRSLFEEAIEGVFRMRLDGTIVAANPAFARIAGYESADELLGTPIRALFACPDEVHRIGEVQGGAEVAWRTRAGRAITVELFGRVLRDEFFQGFVRDVTEIRERKESEHAAREANRAKTHFLANMSHELRTPLNAILGLSDALLQRTYGELTEKQERSLHTVHASGRHLLDLIKDMLDVARIEAGQFPIAMQDVALEPIVRECIAFAIEAAEAKRLRVTTTLDSDIGAVRADPRRLKQVLINLLTNAIKFSRDGGTIAVVARRLANGTAELSVADSGPGIAPGDRERVFEPFVTLDGSMTSAGLGLALVKRIVEMSGDSVRIEDAPHGGACLVVTLHESRAGMPESPPRVHASLERRRRIGPTPLVLLAEDDDANALTVAGYLEARGYRVRVVRDGEAVVTAAADPAVSVVLMDIQLPVMNGLEAIRAIRRAEIAGRIPIVALTAYAMTGDEERCLAAGATAYLAKPVELGGLVKMVEELSRGDRPT